MPIKIRPNPAIPDHEVLRKIGGGAYGEVWLARGVTGALRAVKVVWREDFEDARGFEREFEGILKFEPISREHPALVDVLHVGRSPDGVSFYYYVMEIGDDVESGQDINPVEYEARTLRADSHQATGVPWDTAECIDVGLRLAEALDHLHEHGLAHRDVKPSNVIFVNGRAKLADIGLVAMRGQRTFVGTEGFVPPEGPGSAQADVYSLGKVLYEIATGKDRLSFPDLPDEIPAGADRKRWLELNRVICDICEPRVSKRKISTAAELADALRRIHGGKRRRRRGMSLVLTSLVLGGFAAWAGWQFAKDSGWLQKVVPSPAPELAEMRQMKVISNPPGAEIYDAEGAFLGTANVDFLPVRPGEECVLTLKMTGYRDLTIREKAPASLAREPWPLIATMEVFNPPKPGEPWQDQFRNPFLPVGADHQGTGFVSRKDWEVYAKQAKRPAGEIATDSENGKATEVVVTTPGEANSYCKWYRNLGVAEGYLTDDHDVVPQMDTGFGVPSAGERARKDNYKPFKLLVRRVDYGSITLTTEPAGVEVYLSEGPDSDVPGDLEGIANPTLRLAKLRPGNWRLYLVREGYKPLRLEVKLTEGQEIAKSVILDKNLGVVFGKPWENGIGMAFAPIGQDLMASVWETRVRDYQLFVTETDHEPARPPDFPQTPDHPVVNVSRQDAQDFCDWLTRRERVAERIAQTHEYRLPSDLEWSAIAGLNEDAGISPIWRDARKARVFPWGSEWLQSNQTIANLADLSASLVPGVAINRTIPGYDDGFACTAPVGSFPASAGGLHDLSGNVQEWVADDYSKLGDDGLGVLRGGGWSTFQPENLFTGSRNPVPPGYQDVATGFRVVLAKVPPRAD